MPVVITLNPEFFGFVLACLLGIVGVVLIIRGLLLKQYGDYDLGTPIVRLLYVAGGIITILIGVIVYLIFF